MKEMVGGCCVCSDDRGWPDNPLVYCDGNGCTVAVHQACYGIVTVPTGPWYCRKCESEERQNRVRCELCPCRFGALKRSDRDGWAHVVCALYIPEVRFGNVTSMEPIILQLVPPERFTKTCYICQEKGKTGRSTVGACMQCNKTGCKQQFHVTCAQALGLLCEEAGNYLDNVKYCGYCQHHYSKLKKGGNVKTIPPYKPIRHSDSPSSSDSGPEKDAEAPCPTGTSGASLATSSSKTSKTKKSSTPAAKTAHGGKPSMMSTLNMETGRTETLVVKLKAKKTRRWKKSETGPTETLMVKLKAKKTRRWKKSGRVHHHSSDRTSSKKSSPNSERRPSLHDSSSNEGSDIAAAASSTKVMSPPLVTAPTSAIVATSSAIEATAHKGEHIQASITGAIQPTPGVATSKPDVQPRPDSDTPPPNTSGSVLSVPVESVITNTELAANPDTMKLTKKRRAAQAAAALAAKQNNGTSNETSTITYTSMWDAPQTKAITSTDTLTASDKTKKTRSSQSPGTMAPPTESASPRDTYDSQQPGRPINSPSHRHTDVDRRNAEIERRNSAADLERRNAELERRNAEYERRNAEYDRQSAEYERAAGAERERRTADRDRVVREMGPPPNPQVNNTSASAHGAIANYQTEPQSSPSRSPVSGRVSWAGLQVSYEPQAGTSSIGAVAFEPTDLVKRSQTGDYEQFHYNYQPSYADSTSVIIIDDYDYEGHSLIDDPPLKISYEPQKASYDSKPGPSALMPPPLDTLDHRKSGRGSRGNEMAFDSTPPAPYSPNDSTYSRKRSSNEMLSMPPMPVRHKKRATPTHTITSAECVSMQLEQTSVHQRPAPGSQRTPVLAAYQDLTASPSPEPGIEKRCLSPVSASMEQNYMPGTPGGAALHMLGNSLNPTSSDAEGLSEQLRDELAAQTDALCTGAPTQEPFVQTPLINKAASSTFSDRSPGTGTHSLDQLLERQWEQGSQFLMEQAQHFDIASLLSCLHQLRTENVRLEEHVDNLLQRRDHLLAVNARLAIPLSASSATTGDARRDGRTGVLRNDTGMTSADRAQQMVLRELQQKPS